MTKSAPDLCQIQLTGQDSNLDKESQEHVGTSSCAVENCSALAREHRQSRGPHASSLSHLGDDSVAAFHAHRRESSACLVAVVPDRQFIVAFVGHCDLPICWAETIPDTVSQFDAQDALRLLDAHPWPELANRNPHGLHRAWALL